MSQTQVARPTIAEWVSLQGDNTEPMRRDAARHVSQRWDLFRRFDYKAALRTLKAEDSPHLVGLQLIGDDYSEFYGLDPDERARMMGHSGTLVHFEQVRCQAALRSGSQCSRQSVPGSMNCYQHGGTWVDAEVLARVSDYVSQRLVMGTDRALAALEDLIDNGKSEMVRLQAALGWLDRAGQGASVKVSLEVSAEAEQAADAVRKRLELLNERLGQDHLASASEAPSDVSEMAPAPGVVAIRGTGDLPGPGPVATRPE